MAMPANKRRVAVTASYDRWVLLGNLLEERRRVLGYTYRAPGFERERQVNRRLAADLETAAKKRVNHFTEGSLRVAAHGYQVTYASMAAVLAGKADELTPVRPPRRARRDSPAPPAAPPGPPPDEGTPPMSPEQAAAARPWYDEVNERRVALAFRGVANPTGAQMFGAGTDDARAWDDHGYWSVADRVWFIAELRRWAAGRVPNSGTGTTGA